MTVAQRQLVALENPGLTWQAIVAHANHGVGGHPASDDIAQLLPPRC